MSETGQVARPLAARAAGPVPHAAGVATWAVLVLALTSVTIRPVVEVTGLPHFLVNLDALLTPVATAVVMGLTVRAWRDLDHGRRLATLLVGTLVVALLISWLTASPRSVASLGLGAAMLLLLPLVLYLVVIATAARPSPLMRRTLMLMVLLQLLVGIVQYVALEVAQRAPFAADLVDGTTSHNFWPVFALPASLALVLSGREVWRWLWPLAVTLLAVYAEAKAALMVWAPLMAVLLVVEASRGQWRAPWRRLAGKAGDLDVVGRSGLVVAALAIVLLGLWWSPSVQGTWRVFLGHSESLEQFAVAGNEGGATTPTLREAVPRVGDELTGSVVDFGFGLGPGNSVSHAAEVLAQGTQNGVSMPAPGPVATELLTRQDDIKFRDAQSSLLGLVGDLGFLGALAYAAVLLVGVLTLARSFAQASIWRSARAWAAAALVAGVLAGGSLLDWPEQASVVVPVMFAVLVLGTSAPAPPTVSAHRQRRLRADPRVPAAL